jgi:hypothetical protein
MFDVKLIEQARERGLDSYLESLNLNPDPELVLPEGVIVRQVSNGYYELKNRPGTYRVEFRRDALDRFHDLQDFYLLFRIRDYSGNPSSIGKSLGIQPRDSRIDLNSFEGIVIDNFLGDLARNYAGGLTNGEGFKDRISNLKPGLRTQAFHPSLDEYVVI